MAVTLTPRQIFMKLRTGIPVHPAPPSAQQPLLWLLGAAPDAALLQSAFCLFSHCQLVVGKLALYHGVEEIWKL